MNSAEIGRRVNFALVLNSNGVQTSKIDLGKFRANRLTDKHFNLFIAFSFEGQVFINANFIIETQMPRQKFGFRTGKIYHVGNIGNTGERIFLDMGNYDYFLRKFKVSTSQIFEILAFCLVPNQYHLLIKVKSLENIKQAYSIRKRIPINRVCLNEEEISLFLSQEMGNFLNSYAKAFNKLNGRKGSLFRENFNKMPVEVKAINGIIMQFGQIPLRLGLTGPQVEWDYFQIDEKSAKKYKLMDREKYYQYQKGKGGIGIYDGIGRHAERNIILS